MNEMVLTFVVNAAWQAAAIAAAALLAPRSHAVARARGFDGRLEVAMRGPGAHAESAVTTVRNGRLICDGATDRGRFHAVFQRED